MPINWNGSSTSVRTTKASAIRMTRIMNPFVECECHAAGAAYRAAVILNATGEATKKCGPGQTRRLTGTAGGA